MTFFRNKAFSLANLASLFMFFGMFGSIFLLTQFFQTVQGYSPLSSGLRILPWTLAPMFVAPFAGAMSDRVSPKRILCRRADAPGDRARLDRVRHDAVRPVHLVRDPVHPRGRRYGSLLHPDGEPRPLVRPAGAGGPGSGANNAIRELGGVFGVAALASVFARFGGYETGQTFVDGAARRSGSGPLSSASEPSPRSRSRACGSSAVPRRSTLRRSARLSNAESGVRPEARVVPRGNRADRGACRAKEMLVVLHYSRLLRGRQERSRSASFEFRIRSVEEPTLSLLPKRHKQDGRDCGHDSISSHHEQRNAWIQGLSYDDPSRTG